MNSTKISVLLYDYTAAWYFTNALQHLRCSEELRKTSWYKSYCLFIVYNSPQVIKI